MSMMFLLHVRPGMSSSTNREFLAIPPEMFLSSGLPAWQPSRKRSMAITC